MSIKFSLISVTLLLLCSCGDNSDMGMEYQRQQLTENGDSSIYCYRINWARDGSASFISSSRNPCDGFDSTKDYCYGRGYQVIFYKNENDTLKIYSYGSKPTVPNVGNMKISLVNLEYLELDKFEKRVKNKELSKVQFDSLYKLPCSISNPPIDPKNMKFKTE